MTKETKEAVEELTKLTKTDLGKNSDGIPILCEDCSNVKYFKGEQKCYVWFKGKRECSMKLWDEK